MTLNPHTLGQKANIQLSYTRAVILQRSTLDAQHHIHSLHDIVLAGIIRLVLGRDLQQSGDDFVVIAQNMADVIGNVLIDEDDANIRAVDCFLEELLYSRNLCLRLDHEEVLSLRVAMTNSSQEETRHRVLLNMRCQSL